jgi:hypothetical protein
MIKVNFRCQDDPKLDINITSSINALPFKAGARV